MGSQTNNLLKNSISVILPAKNEAGSLESLCSEIKSVFSKLARDFEIIIVNDGSTDGTSVICEKIYASDPAHFRIIEFRTNFGKAAALKAGFDMAACPLIITMDADGQDDPSEIPAFLKELDAGADIVSGWKQERKDGFIKNFSSKFFNFMTRYATGVKLHDFNCGFKAYRKETVDDIDLYGDLHRYIPVILSAQGFKCMELPVRHRARMNGRTKYGPSRFLRGSFDLATVLFLTRFRMRPLHFFGYIGTAFFSTGFAIGAYLSVLRFAYDEKIGDRPLLLLSVLLMIIGVQIGITGLVGELMASISGLPKKNYHIKKILK